jgi:hypothetical protein
MPPSGEVIFEFTRVGNSVKVSAFDPASMVEISVVGPASAGPTELKLLAFRRLQYVLAKRQNG